jgi:molybdenum cofactor cytidylyltransferase
MSRLSIAGVVLAAGASERMGRRKQTLGFGDSTMVRAVLQAALGAGLDPVVLVAPPDEPSLGGAAAGLGVTVVVNPDPSRGNLSSLRCGLEAGGVDDAVVLLLADMPQVDSAIITRLVEAWKMDRPYAAVCEYRDRVSHPFLLSPHALADLAELEGPKPLWRLLVAEPSPRVLRIGLDRPAPIDVDTLADYQRLLADEGLSSDAGET